MFTGSNDAAAGSKRGVGVRESEDEERLLSRFRTIVKEENSAIVESFERRFTAIENRQEQLEHRVEELERKLGRVPGGSGIAPGNQGQFVPHFLELKGFCPWKERLTNGATRADATELLNLLIPLLPEDLQKHVKPFELRGLRNYSIKVPIEPSVIREVKGIWSDNLKQKTVVGPGKCELYVTFEKSPEQRARYSTMGKLFEFVKAKRTNQRGSVKAMWAPDFCVYNEPSEGMPHLVGSISTSSEVIWDTRAASVFGVDSEELVTLFADFRRP